MSDTPVTDAMIEAARQAAPFQDYLDAYSSEMDEEEIADAIKAALSLREQEMGRLASVLRGALETLLHATQAPHVSFESGCCMCGDDMVAHADPMSAGHTPVDSGIYYAEQAFDAARNALAAQPEDPRISTLAAQVKELRDALEWFCDRRDKGKVRSTRTYERFKALLTSTEHPSDDAVTQIERRALERAAEHFDKSAESATRTAGSIPFFRQNDQAHWYGVAKSSHLAASAIRALAEGGE